MAEFGRLDILVNNAGTGVMAPIEEIAAEDVDRVLHVNVRAPYLACQAAAAHLGEGGRIVTIGSCMAERVAFPGASLYATGKAALTGLTKALAREYAASGITVNPIPPSGIDTPMSRDSQAAGHLPDSATMARAIPVGYLGDGDDIAATCAFLCSEEARFITGQVVGVNGGSVI